LLAGYGYPEPLHTGDIAPDFVLNRFDTTTPVHLRDLAGQIVVLDFFAYWCGPCKTAASELQPQVQQYYAARGGNPLHVPVQMISLSIDGSDQAATRTYIATYGLDFVLDDSAQTAFTPYSTGFIPRFAIINGVAGANYPQWQIIFDQVGYGTGNYVTFRNNIDTVVPEPSAIVLLLSGVIVLLGWKGRRLKGTLCR